MYETCSHNNDTFKVRQGDQYPLQFLIKDAEGNTVTADVSIISNVSITIGDVTKAWNQGTGLLVYNSANKTWDYHLTQAETLAMKPGRYDVLIRVKFVSTDIDSEAVQQIEVLKSIDRSVL